jgi:hypothetical protein
MATLAARQSLLEQVRGLLPAELAASLTSAGVEGRELRLGAHSGVWATRLRYVTGAMHAELSAAAGTPIDRVKIRVAPPRG